MPLHEWHPLYSLQGRQHPSSRQLWGIAWERFCCGRQKLCHAAQVIVSTACKTAGEALREIDIKDIIKSDFVLVSGDVVSNMDLGAALEAHKARRDKDKNALMTMVCLFQAVQPLIDMPLQMTCYCHCKQMLNGPQCCLSHVLMSQKTPHMSLLKGLSTTKICSQA